MKKQFKRMAKRSLREMLGGAKPYRTRLKSKRTKTSLKSRTKGSLKSWLKRRIKRLFD